MKEPQKNRRAILLKSARFALLGLGSLALSVSPLQAALFDDVPGLSQAGRDALRIHFDAGVGVSLDGNGGVTAWEGRDGSGNPVYTAQAQGSGPSTNISVNAAGDALVFTESQVADTRFLYTDLYAIDDKLISSGEVTVFWLGSYSAGTPQGDGTLGRYAYNIGIRGPGVSGQARGMSHQRRDAGQVVAVFPGSGVTYRGDSILTRNDTPTVWRTDYDYVGGSPFGTHAFFATDDEGTRTDLGMAPLTATTIEFTSFDPHLYIGAWNDGVVSSSGSGGFTFIGEMSQLLIFEGDLDPADIDAIEAWLVSQAEQVEAPLTDFAWTGSVDDQWDATSLNWTEQASAAAWGSDGQGQQAIFGAVAERNPSIAGNITAEALRFDAAGYTVDGPGTLALAGERTVDTIADATIAAELVGNSGLTKNGDGQLTLTGANSYTESTVINAGELLYTGSGSSSGAGTLILAPLADQRAGLVVDTSESLSFGGASLIGAGENAAGFIRLVNGTLTTNGPTSRSFLEIGGGIPGNGSYGAFLVEGGRYVSDLGDTTSGVRVGNDGLGYLRQTGGEIFSAGFFGIGGFGESSGEGVVDLLGGELEIAPELRLQIGFRAGAVGTLNLGTQAGGNATIRHLNEGGFAVAGNSATDRATLNLNSGRLILGGPLFRAGSTAGSVVNFNGGTLVAGLDAVQLTDDSLPVIRLYAGGLTVDTAGLTATLGDDLTTPAGEGIYPSGGTIAVADGGSGYLGAPLVTVTSSGLGNAATATAEMVDGRINAIVMTAPGQEFSDGDIVTFSFRGGGPEVSAPDFNYTLTSADLAPNDQGGLTVDGGGRLVLSGNADYAGPTQVLSGTLQSDALLGATTVTVAAAGELTGAFDTYGDVVIEGALAPGNGVGLGRGLGDLEFRPGSHYEFQIRDWLGFAGVGFDSTEFDATVITATSAEPLTIVVAPVGLSNFSESNRDFVLVDSFEVSGLAADNWTVDASQFSGTGTWALAAEDGRLILRYTAGAGTAYSNWAASFSELTDTAPGADPDGDGLSNLLEFVFRRDPTQPSDSALTEATLNEAGAFVFTFVRRSDSSASTTQIFEYGSDLASWTSLPIPAASEGAVVIESGVPESGAETVQITIPAQDPPQTRMFGRLRVEFTN